MPYLCTTFALIKQPKAKTERLGQRSNQINTFFEVFEQLNKFSFSSQEEIFQNNTFEIRAKIYNNLFFTMESLILAQDER